MRSKPAARRQLRRMCVGFIAGFVACGILVSGGAVQAYFTAQATATATVKSKSIAITVNNFAALDAEYINSVLTDTDSFTVENTGQTSGTTTVTVTAAGSFASNLPVRVWPVAEATSCTAAATVPANALSATWSSIPITTSLVLAPSARQTYCVRTSIADRTAVATATGTQSAIATVSAVITGDGWSAQATTALTATQRTRDIFPLDSAVVPGAPLSRWFTISNSVAPTICADVASNGATAGSKVISAACDTTASQRWQLQPVLEGTPSLVTLAPKHVPGMRLGVNASGHPELQAASTALAQRWYIQKASATSWQLVSAVDGRCLVVRETASSGQSNVAACTAANTKLKLTREPLIFVPDGVAYKINMTATQETTPIVLQQRLLGVLNWVDVAETANGSVLGANMLLALLGEYEFRVVYKGTQTVLYQGSVSKILVSEVTPVSGFG